MDYCTVFSRGGKSNLNDKLILESFTAQGEFQSGYHREGIPDPQNLNVPMSHGNIEYRNTSQYSYCFSPNGLGLI